MQFLKYKETRARGNENFPLEIYQIDSSHARYVMVCHWHLEYEIIHVIKGKLHCHIDNDLITAKSGDILFVNEGELHSAVPDDCEYECLVFDMSRLLKTHGICAEKLAEFAADGQKFPHKIETPALQEHIRRLMSVCKQNSKGREFILSGLLLELFGFMLEENNFLTASSQSQSKRAVLRLKKSLDLIENSYSEHLTLQRIADTAQMSPKYFCAFFKKMTGFTPIEYLKQYRLSAACLMIQNSELTITEIALECGFNDLSYFIHEFKNEKGVTPKQYQALLHAGEQR